MELWDTLGLTTEEAVRMAFAGFLVALLIGGRLLWRSRREERVRIDLNDRLP